MHTCMYLERREFHTLSLIHTVVIALGYLLLYSHKCTQRPSANTHNWMLSPENWE